MSSQWVAFVVLVLGLMVLSVTAMCSWLTPEGCTNVTTPVLGLYFIHMRKAGGSTVLRILKSWLIRHGCVTKELVDKHSSFLNYHFDRGVPVLQGSPAFLKEFPRSCPYVDIVHNEYSCTRGADMIKRPSLRPPFAVYQGHTLRYAAITTIRDPIERIGSQAFYRQGVGLAQLHKVAKANCGHEAVIYTCKVKRDPKACECSNKALLETKEILRSNDKLWFEWIFQSTAGNFIGDFYSANYYVRRIGYSLNKPLASPMLDCIERSKPCDGVRIVNADSVNTLGHRMHCPTENSPLLNLTMGLEAAKILLRDHVDFVLTSQFDESITADIFARVLHDPSFPKYYNNSNHENSGHVSKNISGYSSFMSDAVLAYITADNKYDIELYNYAVDLYSKKYGPRSKLTS